MVEKCLSLGFMPHPPRFFTSAKHRDQMKFQMFFPPISHSYNKRKGTYEEKARKTVERNEVREQME